MSGSPHISVPHSDSDASNFTPITTLPETLNNYAHLSQELRETMTDGLKLALSLTDKMALRSAALPQGE